MRKCFWHSFYTTEKKEEKVQVVDTIKNLFSVIFKNKKSQLNSMIQGYVDHFEKVSQ